MSRRLPDPLKAVELNRELFEDVCLTSTYFYYGKLSKADYKRMLAEQGGVCAICQKPEKRKALAIDHCHKTGIIRGLLCMRCNTALGHMDDDTDRLYRAIKYLLEKGKR